MAFAPTPPRRTQPAQLLSLSAITSTPVQQSGGGAVGTVTITSSPTTGTVGTAISLAGTVLPSVTAVRVGLSNSSTTAPAAWIAATVSDTGWTSALTPSVAGIYFIWAQQTAAPSVSVVSAAVTVAAAGSGTVTITSPPTTGTAGTAMALAGTVSPSASAVQIGLSTSSTVAPTSWTSATVSGTGWTASLTPSAAGTFFVWAEQTSATTVRAISAAITVVAAAAALSYSLIAGSGNASLTAVTLSTATIGSAPATDWTSSIVHAATDVAPNIVISAIGSITACKFWFDTTSTGVTVPAIFGNQASLNNSVATFYAFSVGFGTPTGAPAAPSTAGTYYGKFAFYNSTSVLLGVFTTSAITVI